MASLSRRQWLRRGALAAAALPVLPGLSLARSADPPAGLSAFAGLPDPIRLHANENPYGPSDRAREAMVEALGRANEYVQREHDLDALRQAIAAREQVTPDHVVLGAGSSGILCMAAVAFARDGGAVVAPNPTFFLLTSYAEQLGAAIRRVPLTDAFAHDLDAMDRRTTSDARLVYVCNPNNPTATITDGARLRDFCESTASRVPVFVDEAYHEYADGLPGYASMMPLVRAGHNVVVSRTFSKLYGLAGMRIGYALARPDLAARLDVWRMSLLNTPGVRAALASLRDEPFRTSSRTRNDAARAQLSDALSAHGLHHAPSFTNYLYVHVGAQRHDFPERMAAHGITVTRIIDGEWTRITVGTAAHVARLAQALPQVL